MWRVRHAATGHPLHPGQWWLRHGDRGWGSEHTRCVDMCDIRYIDNKILCYITLYCIIYIIIYYKVCKCVCIMTSIGRASSPWLAPAPRCLHRSGCSHCRVSMVGRPRWSLQCRGLAFERFGLNLSTSSLPSGHTYQQRPHFSHRRNHAKAPRICVDADGPGTIFAAGETGISVYMSPVRLAAAWGTVVRLVCAPAGCSSTTGFLGTDCSAAATGRALLPTALPSKLLALANDSKVLSGEAFELLHEAPPGSTLRLCLDVDGSGPMPVGDARGVYTGVQELRTHGVPQGLAETISLACHATGGCQDLSQLERSALSLSTST